MLGDYTMEQQQAWNKEYRHVKGVPTSTRIRPSSAVKRLFNYIQEHNIKTGKRIIDLGCGTGRNSIYLLDQGNDVTAVDFARSALAKLEATAHSHPARQHLSVAQVNLAHKLPFADNAFDIALDIVTTMTLLPRERPGFEAELRRIVRPGGLFLSWVLSINDGVLKEKAPGKTSTTIHETGITDYYFAEHELSDLYKQWELLKLDEVSKRDSFYGKEYERRIWWMVLKNNKKE